MAGEKVPRRPAREVAMFCRLKQTGTMPVPLGCVVKGDGHPGFFPTGGRAMDHAGFDGLVEGRIDPRKQLGGIGFLSRRQKPAIIFFEAAQTRFDAQIVQMFALAVTHPAFGRGCIRHSR